MNWLGRILISKICLHNCGQTYPSLELLCECTGLGVRARRRRLRLLWCELLGNETCQSKCTTLLDNIRHNRIVAPFQELASWLCLLPSSVIFLNLLISHCSLLAFHHHYHIRFIGIKIKSCIKRIPLADRHQKMFYNNCVLRRQNVNWSINIFVIILFVCLVGGGVKFSQIAIQLLFKLQANK